MKSLLHKIGYALHLAGLEITRNRPARFINGNALNRWRHPHGDEPEVLKILCDKRWKGDVWDVGAHVGHLARRVAEHHRVIAFECNLALLPFLGNNLRGSNSVVVPCALTPDGQPFLGSANPFIHALPQNIILASMSVADALKKFGRPALVKIDIEGGEYGLLACPDLANIPLLVEFHRGIPANLKHWTVQKINNGRRDVVHALLMPKSNRVSHSEHTRSLVPHHD